MVRGGYSGSHGSGDALPSSNRPRRDPRKLVNGSFRNSNLQRNNQRRNNRTSFRGNNSSRGRWENQNRGGGLPRVSTSRQNRGGGAVSVRTPGGRGGFRPYDQRRRRFASSGRGGASAARANGRGRGGRFSRLTQKNRTSAETVDTLNAQLDAYMGDDAVKRRLDKDLEGYFDAPVAEAAAVAAPETDAAGAMDVTTDVAL